MRGYAVAMTAAAALSTLPVVASLPSQSSNYSRSGAEKRQQRYLKAMDIGDIEDSTGVTIPVLLGIVGGIVLVGLALCCVCRRRRRARAEPKLGDSLLSPTTATAPTHRGGVASTEPTTQSLGYSAGGDSSSRDKSNASSHSLGFQGATVGLWDDETIVAVRIPKEKVKATALVSRGGYGEVHRGTYYDQVVAIKTLLPESRKNMKQINAFLSEVKLMAALEHERIVTFVGVAWDALTDVCVVSEFMEGGDLRAALTRFEEVEHRPHGFDHDKVKIALHISHALTYLHSFQPIVLHRDLKSKNILLDRDLNAKLTDFGVSRERSDQTMTAGVGTSLWMAPEVMIGERYDQKADVFSFGVVLSELDSHQLPYSQVKESDSGRRIPETAILHMVSSGRLKVSFSPNACPEMVELANDCTALNPAERPTAAEVLYSLSKLIKKMDS